MSDDVSVKRRHLKIADDSQKSTQSTDLPCTRNHQCVIPNEARLSLSNFMHKLQYFLISA